MALRRQLQKLLEDLVVRAAREAERRAGGA